MKGGAALASCAATFALWSAAVVLPAWAALTRAGGGEVPPTFQGNQVAATTLCWAVGIALAAAVPGWVAGRAIRHARVGTAVLACSLVAVALPAYAVFWSWWQAAGPGSAVGDWAARNEHSNSLRLCLLTLGLVSWCWPLVAWCVAAQRDDGESVVRDLHDVDAARWHSRLARAWRTDWPGLALGVGIAAFVVAGSTIAFDLAQVNTFGFELRTLNAQAVPAGAVFRAALPAIAIAAVGAIALSAWPVARAGEGGGREHRPLGWSAVAVVTVTLVIPCVLFVWAVISQGALHGFATAALPGATGTLLAAAAAGLLCGAVALGHLVLFARGDAGDRRARAWKWIERALLAGWLAAALVPGTVYALAVTLAFNRQGPLLWVYDTPAVVVLAEVGRYAAGAAWIGRLAARREPEERRHLRLADGALWTGALSALAPQARAAAIGAALLVAALGAGEVVVTAVVEPPGWQWAAARLLNAIHYQQPDAVLGTLLALGALAACAGIVVAVTMRRLRALAGRTLSVALALAGPLTLAGVLTGSVAGALLSGGCRENSEDAGTLHAVRWFGATGRGPGVFEYPRALEIDPRDGSVLVIDRQARVHRFDKDGRFLGGWQMPDFEKGKPTGFTVAADGTVYIADTHYHRVMVYSPDGQELRRWGGYGTEHGHFIFPCDVTLGPDGLVYVAEFGSNDRIQVFRPTGEFVRQIGGPGREPGQFERPQTIEFAANGDLYVADALSHRIQVLDSNGTFKRVIGGVGTKPGEFVYPYGMRLLPDGTMLVAEFGGNRVQRLDCATGASLGAWHFVDGAPAPAAVFLTDGNTVRSIPTNQNDLRIPWAVAWRDGEMYVLDSGHSRVLVAQAPLRTQ